MDFNKIKQSDGSWKFEKDGINLILDDFTMEDKKHRIMNTEKAIAFFNFMGEVYSVSNQLDNFKTAEDFFQAMKQQYLIFSPGVKTA
jgi:hypothetical protein